ncbi:MAG: sialate O-acetylesterase [Pirellulaceae bacterium]|nr:sialate O-acetylesterase [Pirellulaceae bacterium]
MNVRITILLNVTALTLLMSVHDAAAKDIPKQLPNPDTKPPVTNKPVKVYILSGQSNMVGIGQVRAGGTRWSGVTDATVSVYEGQWSPNANYDELTSIEAKALPVYGGVKPTPFPGGGTQVVRGFIELKTSGVYRFNPGYQASTFNIMELDGIEVYRKDVGKEAEHADFEIAGGKKYPFKITFLTKEANGLGWWWRTDIPGTLDTLVKNRKFPHLVDDKGDYTARNDVWYKGLVTATASKWLTVGCGAGRNQIGPELQFGHIMGYYHDEPVIILKSSQGNRSLGWDFLPPGSERFTYEGRTYAGYKDTPSSWIEGEPKKKVNWYAGKQYDDCFKAVREVLDNFATHFPQYKNQDYEIAGFVWWQGHKDGNPAHASRYEHNLVHLIRTLRKEFKAPKAPFVIGTIGFGGWEMKGPHLTVANAQLALSGEKGKYPEFASNVLTVETRGFWKDASVSPRNQGFHYNQNAETYMMVGDALGRGMVKLLDNKNE